MGHRRATHARGRARHPHRRPAQGDRTPRLHHGHPPPESGLCGDRARHRPARSHHRARPRRRARAPRRARPPRGRRRANAHSALQQRDHLHRPADRRGLRDDAGDRGRRRAPGARRRRVAPIRRDRGTGARGGSHPSADREQPRRRQAAPPRTRQRHRRAHGRRGDRHARSPHALRAAQRHGAALCRRRVGGRPPHGVGEHARHLPGARQRRQGPRDPAHERARDLRGHGRWLRRQELRRGAHVPRGDLRPATRSCRRLHRGPRRRTDRHRQPPQHLATHHARRHARRPTHRDRPRRAHPDRDRRLRRWAGRDLSRALRLPQRAHA